MAIAFDAESNSNGNNDFSWTHTAGTLTAGIALVGIASSPSEVVTGVTYDSAAMTSIGTAIRTTEVKVSMFYILAPPAGAKTIAVDMAGSVNRVNGHCLTFSGVKQDDPIGAWDAATGVTDTSISNTVASAASQLVVDVVGVNANLVLTVGAGQTARSTNSGTYMSSAMSTEAGAASVVMSWSWTGSNHAAEGAVALKSAPETVVLDPIVFNAVGVTPAKGSTTFTPNPAAFNTPYLTIGGKATIGKTPAAAIMPAALALIAGKLITKVPTAATLSAIATFLTMATSKRIIVQVPDFRLHATSPVTSYTVKMPDFRLHTKK